VVVTTVAETMAAVAADVESNLIFFAQKILIKGSFTPFFNFTI
jgi:hypothetical protein